jgi:WD40 repeat protein
MLPEHHAPGQAELLFAVFVGLLTSCIQGHDEIVWAVEVSGHRLFSASADKTIRVWDIESRRCERVLEDHTRPVLSLACADGKLFSGSYDYSIKVEMLLILLSLH